jgi:hypothetical protein
MMVSWGVIPWQKISGASIEFDSGAYLFCIILD